MFCYWVQICKCNTKVVRYEVLTRVSRIKDSSLLRYYIVLMGKQLPKSWRNILLLSLAQPWRQRHYPYLNCWLLLTSKHGIKIPSLTKKLLAPYYTGYYFSSLKMLPKPRCSPPSCTLHIYIMQLTKCWHHTTTNIYIFIQIYFFYILMFPNKHRSFTFSYLMNCCITFSSISFNIIYTNVEPSLKFCNCRF